MKFTNMKLAALSAGIILIFAAFGAYAGESHMAETLKHAQAAVKADDGKGIAKHAEQPRPTHKLPVNT